MDTVETLRSRVSVPPVSHSLHAPSNDLVENARLASLTKSTWSGGSKHSQRAAEAMREQNFMARLATCGLIGVQKSQQVKKIRASQLSILLRHSGAGFPFPLSTPTRCMPPQNVSKYLVENSGLTSLPKSTWSGGSKHSQRLATCGLIGVQESQPLLSILLGHSGAGFPSPLKISCREC